MVSPIVMRGSHLIGLSIEGKSTGLREALGGKFLRWHAEGP
jgi:hypothetical protein